MAVAPGNNLLGAQFVEVGTDAAAGINDIVIASADLPGMDLDSLVFQTSLKTWTGTGYTSYYLVGAGQGELLGDASLDGKWVDGNYQLVDVTIPASDGFWIQTTGSGTATMMGQVATAESTTIDVVAGLNLLSSAYPKDINIQDVVASADLPGMDLDSFEFQTFLMTWTGAGYTSYYLIGAGQGELLGDASLDGKWVDGSYQLVDVTIPAGSGFWVQTTGAGTVTFAK